MITGKQLADAAVAAIPMGHNLRPGRLPNVR